MGYGPLRWFGGLYSRADALALLVYTLKISVTLNNVLILVSVTTPASLVSLYLLINTSHRLSLFQLLT